MAVTNSINISTLYARLNQMGLSKNFVRENGLPEWWTEECETLPDATITAAAYISRRFNLEFQSLITPESQPTFQQFTKTCYKKVDHHVLPEISIASHLGRRVAELVVKTYTKEYQPIAGITAYQIREEIINLGKVVNLETLLNFCGKYGIPVFHFARFPKTVKKFYGMVTDCISKPVVVIGLQDLSPSRLAFILAHELGHIALNHLKAGETINDEEIKLDDVQNNDECAANEFAIELLLGKSDQVYYFPQSMKAESLALSAREKAKRDHNDPGAIAWNYGWYKKNRFGVARKAVNLIEKNENAPKMINQQLSQLLDWDCLSEDNQEYLALALKLDGDKVGG
jgi:hypothetical protein